MKCPFYSVAAGYISERCDLTGHACHVMQENQAWCLRRIWAIEYEAKTQGARKGLPEAAKSTEQGRLI